MCYSGPGDCLIDSARPPPRNHPASFAIEIVALEEAEWYWKIATDMATANIPIKYRPVRIGFLVRPGELADLQKTAGLCTLLWGGIRNPIVPVGSASDGAAKRLLTLFQIDVLFPAENCEAIAGFIERYPNLALPRLHSREIFYEEWPTKKNKIAYLDAINIVDRYWEQEFKHAPKNHKSNCRLVTWEEADELKDIFALSYGYYPTNYNLQEDFRAAFLNGLRASEVRIGLTAQPPEELTTTITPLRLTGLRLDSYTASNRDWTGVYFGDQHDFADLVCFWNLRAAGSAIEFAALTDLKRFENLIRAHLKWIDDLPRRHPNIEDDIAVSYRNNQTKVMEALEQFPTKKQKVLSQCDEMIWNGDNVQPATFCLDQEYSLAFIEQEQRHYHVTVSLPEKKFLAATNRRGENKWLAVSLSPLGDFGYPGHTLAPPFRTELNEFYSRQIGTDPRIIRSESEGLGVLVTASGRFIRLRPLANRAVLEALLGVAGIKAEASQPGRLADRLMDKLDGLEGARVFKIRGVRKLLASLDPQATTGRGNATALIWNQRQFAQHEDLYIEQRDTPRLTTSAVFDFLLKNEFFRAGLELQCDDCLLRSWLALRQIDDVWVCEFCGHRNLTSLHIQDRGDWKFRKSGLLAKDNNQEGAIPVILGLLVLKRILDFHHFIGVTSLKLKDRAWSCEVDFMVIHYRPGKEIEWALGEAKSEGGRIEATGIDNMKHVASKLAAGVGAKTHFAFVKPADSFLPDEIELFRALQREGIPPILITNKEIEPYHPYWEGDDAERLPQKYAHSLGEMALNSASRYLQD
jgi:hypothetical protein